VREKVGQVVVPVSERKLAWNLLLLLIHSFLLEIRDLRDPTSGFSKSSTINLIPVFLTAFFVSTFLAWTAGA
jgi:hypothetical protein